MYDMKGIKRWFVYLKSTNLYFQEMLYVDHVDVTVVSALKMEMLSVVKK